MTKKNNEPHPTRTRKPRPMTVGRAIDKMREIDEKIAKLVKERRKILDALPAADRVLVSNVCDGAEEKLPDWATEQPEPARVQEVDRG